MRPEMSLGQFARFGPWPYFPWGIMAKATVLVAKVLIRVCADSHASNKVWWEDARIVVLSQLGPWSYFPYWGMMAKVPIFMAKAPILKWWYRQCEVRYAYLLPPCREGGEKWSTQDCSSRAMLRSFRRIDAGGSTSGQGMAKAARTYPPQQCTPSQ
jgi:hypothetical protein